MMIRYALPAVILGLLVGCMDPIADNNTTTTTSSTDSTTQTSNPTPSASLDVLIEDVDSTVNVFYARVINNTTEANDENLYPKLQVGWSGQLGNEVYKSETSLEESFPMVTDFDSIGFMGQTCGDLCVPLGSEAPSGVEWTGVAQPVAGVYYEMTITGHPTESCVIDVQEVTAPSGTQRVFYGVLTDANSEVPGDRVESTLSFANGTTTAIPLHGDSVSENVKLMENRDGKFKVWYADTGSLATELSSLTIDIIAPAEIVGSYTLDLTGTTVNADITRITIGEALTGDNVLQATETQG